MAKKRAVYVKCPFYRKEEGIKLCCEGLHDGGFIHLIFPTKESRVEFERHNCKGAWKECPVAQILNRKWEYE